jgi:hypothetical protein
MKADCAKKEALSGVNAPPKALVDAVDMRMRASKLMTFSPIRYKGY